MKTAYKIISAVFAFLLLIQLVPVDRTNPPVDKKADFVRVLKTPPNIAEMLRSSCYDCHSNETVYPEYAYVAPLSWSVKHHVNEGREHLNFSVWGNYNADLKKSMLEKAVLNIEDRKMPLPAYLIYHEQARLTDAQRKVLQNYLENVLKQKNY